jgi:peptidoglycan/LPS O-acetylase OafA/YrhL
MTNRTGRSPTVAQALLQPRNGFTATRLILALAVVLSHAFSVTTGQVLDEPLARATGFTLGEHAVNGFFAVSGFLVTMSFDRRGWRDYVVSRALRILPGLVVATLAVALLLGGFMTRLPLGDYLASSGLWRFVSGTLTTFKSNAALPGVFEGNPFRFPMGTVWTLKYEVLCYAAVLVLGILGLTRSKPAALALVAGLALAVVGLQLVTADAPKGVQTALRLPLIFAFGGALYVWREAVRLSGFVVALALAAIWIAGGTAFYEALLFTGTTYAVLWLALASPLARRVPEPGADLSYGTYLYGWPVQQALHAMLPAVGAAALLVPSIVATLAVAALSWFLVEKPALALKSRSLGRRALGAEVPAAP